MCLPLTFRVTVQHCCCTSGRVLLDLGLLVVLALRSRRGIAAENLFVRKQLALYQERKTKPHQADDSTRWIMATLSRWFEWRRALVNVKPDTLTRWHRRGFRLFWRWKSKPAGRPAVPKKLQVLIRRMAAATRSAHLHRRAAIVIAFRQDMFSEARQCTADCTTSIGWRRWRHEARSDFLRTTILLPNDLAHAPHADRSEDLVRAEL